VLKKPKVPVHPTLRGHIRLLVSNHNAYTVTVNLSVCSNYSVLRVVFSRISKSIRTTLLPQTPNPLLRVERTASTSSSTSLECTTLVLGTKSTSAAASL
jgi:hypothetical protein